MWLFLIINPQAKLAINTHAAVVDIHNSVTNIHAVVSEVQHDTTNTHTLVSDIYRNIFTTQERTINLSQKMAVALDPSPETHFPFPW